MREFRIATIGCGSMATIAHGPSYARYAASHPGVLLAACCDLDAHRAELFRQRFGFARAYTNLDDMLAAETPDAVCLVAPVERTAALSCRVLATGAPLLMEKPPGQDLIEIDAMIAAARASGAPTQVAFNRRHAPLLTALRSRLADRTLQHLTCEFTRTGRDDDDFSTTAIHGIDAARFLAGSDYASLRFTYQPLPRFGTRVANFFVDGTFVSGATLHLAFCPVAGEVVERYTIQADGATLALHLPIWNSPDFPGRLRIVESNAVVADLPCPVASSEPDAMFVANGFYAENAAFFDAIRAGRLPDGNLEDARQSVAVAQAIRERRTTWPER